MGWAEQLAGHYPETPLPELDSRQVFDFLLHLQSERKLAGATLNQANSSGITLKQALHDSRHHMTKASAWSAIKVAKYESGLMKHHEKICIHTLRHSYATHMLEAGTSVRQVAAYLGHSSLKPTMVYLHLTEVSEEKARAALATLPGV